MARHARRVGARAARAASRVPERRRPSWIRDEHAGLTGRDWGVLGHHLNRPEIGQCERL